VDASPVVVGKALYCGSGVSRAQRSPAIFCLATEDGSVRWQGPVDLPAWGSPAVDGSQVFFGLGNGRLLCSADPPEKPAGAVLCVQAATGTPCWRCDVSDAVLARPAVGPEQAYFGSRDGCCYGVDRRDGRRCWQTNLGSPIVTTPALCEAALYVIASAGRVCRLDAHTGEVAWTFDVAAHSHTTPVLVSSPVVSPGAPAGGRLILFGTELKNPATSAAVLYCLQE
jgi:outer membrane protein assembly factor BamB